MQSKEDGLAFHKCRDVSSAVAAGGFAEPMVGRCCSLECTTS